MLACATRIGAWAAKHPDHKGSVHWWPADLPPDLMALTAAVANSSAIADRLSSATHQAVPIDEMNEVYLAAASHQLTSSDEVFVQNHIDGPYGILPGKVYRTMVACTPNDSVVTKFPLTNESILLDVGEWFAFDYHREPHRIERTKPQRAPRVCLKLHYVMVRRTSTFGIWWAYTLSKWSAYYNTSARTLFLKTRNPCSASSYVRAVLVLTVTKMAVQLEVWIGSQNLPRVVLVGIVLFLLPPAMSMLVACLLSVFMAMRGIHSTSKREMRLATLALAATCMR